MAKTTALQGHLASSVIARLCRRPGSARPAFIFPANSLILLAIGHRLRCSLQTLVSLNSRCSFNLRQIRIPAAKVAGWKALRYSYNVRTLYICPTWLKKRLYFRQKQQFRDVYRFLKKVIFLFRESLPLADVTSVSN